MNFLRTLLGVCAGMRFYQFALAWTAGDALKYLLKLALLLALIGTPIVLRNSYHWAGAALERLELSKAWPEFSIEKGRVVSTLPQPHIRVYRDFAFVLDTKSTKPPIPAGATAGITITADSFLLWSEINPHPAPIDISMFPDGHVDAAYLRALLRQSRWVCGLLLAMMMLIGFFCGGLLQVALFGGIAALVEQGIEPSYRFDQLFSFGTLALTPASVAALTFAGFGIGFDNQLLVYLLVFAFYFTGSTTACRRLLLPPGARVEDDD
ncbi:MAG: DUF1189 family protein [Verrucomicrobia bacterium]|nr:DUF1189 family protein [Verrucomicrobiota bacterium]